MNFKFTNLISKLDENNRLEKVAKKYIDEPKRIALKITASYLIIGTLWILLSDLTTEYLASNKEIMTIINLAKGWVYVITTGILIYIFVNVEIKKTKDIEKELIKSNKDIIESNLELEAAYSQLAASENILKQQYDQIIVNQRKLIESEERYRIIFEATNDAIWEEKDGVITFSNRWYEFIGYSREEFEQIGDWKRLIHPQDKSYVCEKINEHIKKRTPYYSCEYRIKTKEDNYKWVQASGKALFDINGHSYFKAGSIRDITEIKEFEQKLKHLAYHDQLTGLKNSMSMKENFNILANGNKESISLLYIDIDNFKYINDTLGHSFGDLLLINISERLSNYESINCNLYRLGGDEYIILFDSYDDIRDVERLAVKILKEFNNSFEIEKINLFIKISMGISLYPNHGDCIDEILKNADIAVRKAKELGRNRIIIYNQPMNEAITERVIIEKQLRKALDNNEFELYYQPQIDIKENKISGFEALIRWKNSELGFVSPKRFIGIAETTHLIIPIGEWVLKNACIFLKRIHQQGNKNMTISINVSILQLLQDDFVTIIMENLDMIGVNPKYLEIEITESILMESYETISKKLKMLSASGIRIALDDFGKGYSSLNYLKQLPISTLKIDKSFVDTISSKERNKSLIDLIVKIGRSMDLCVIAEGVETKQQLKYLEKHKCNKIQGYFFSKPLPEKEAIKVIEQNKIPFKELDRDVYSIPIAADGAQLLTNKNMRDVKNTTEKNAKIVNIPLKKF